MCPIVKSRLFSSQEYSINSSPGSMRQKVRIEVRAELRDTVSDPRDLDGEWLRVDRA